MQALTGPGVDYYNYVDRDQRVTTKPNQQNRKLREGWQGNEME